MAVIDDPRVEAAIAAGNLINSSRKAQLTPDDRDWWANVAMATLQAQIASIPLEVLLAAGFVEDQRKQDAQRKQQVFRDAIVDKLTGNEDG